MHRYTEEEIAKKAFELIDDGFLIGLTEENDLPEEINLQDRTVLKARAYLIDGLESDVQGEILERVKVIYDAEESTNNAIEYPTDYFKFDDIDTITIDGLEWYREDLESL